jgi:hypothetical protein
MKISHEGDNRHQHPCPTNLHGLCVELYLPYPEGDNRQQHPYPTNLHGLCVELYLPYQIKNKAVISIYV